MTNSKQEIRPPKIGVVIGCGGLKGVGSLELLSYLEEAQIKVDLFVGCSVGAIVAVGGYMFPPSIQREVCHRFLTQKVFSHLDYRGIAAMMNFPFTKFNPTHAILKPDKTKELIRHYFGETQIEDLKTKVVIQTTDLLSGEGHILTSGSCADAIYASLAMPPFMPPQRIGDRLLIDGAFSSPLPIIEAVKRDMDVIIVMSFTEKPTEKPSSLMDLFFHVAKESVYGAIAVHNAVAINMHHHEIIFVPVVIDRVVNLWESHSVDYFFDKAKEAVQAQKHAIQKAIENYYSLQTMLVHG